MKTIKDLNILLEQEQQVKRVTDSLSHVGIPGMHWGVRRSRPAGRNTATGKLVPHSPVSDHAKARQLQSKGVKNLTTDELKQLTTRLQLEQQYSKLGPASKYKKAMSYVKSMNDAGTTLETAFKLANGPLGKAVKETVTRVATKKAS